MNFTMIHLLTTLTISMLIMMLIKLESKISQSIKKTTQFESGFNTMKYYFHSQFTSS